MTLTQEHHEMLKQLHRVNCADEALACMMAAILETREQQKKMVEYMKSQENLTYGGIIKTLRKLDPESD